MTPLHIAARDGLYSIAVLLLAFGAQAHKSTNDYIGNHKDSSSKGIRKQITNGVEVRDNPLADPIGKSPHSEAEGHFESSSTNDTIYHPLITYKRALRNPLQLTVCAGCLEVTALLIHDGSPLHDKYVCCTHSPNLYDNELCAH